MKLLDLSALLCALMAPTLAAGPGPEAESEPEGPQAGGLEVLKRTWNWKKIGDRYFFYVHERRTWNEAEQYCSSLGGDLASVHSASDYYQVQALVQSSSGGFAQTWIGGNDMVHEGVWIWSDGTDFSYTKWCGGEPNNAGGNEDCLEINATGRKCWNDVPCNTKLPSICVRTEGASSQFDTKA